MALGIVALGISGLLCSWDVVADYVPGAWDLRLWAAAEVHARPPPRRRACRVGPENTYLAEVAAPVALQHLDGRGLPGAVRPEEREDLTRPDDQVDPAHRLNVPVPFPQPARPDRDITLAIAVRRRARRT